MDNRLDSSVAAAAMNFTNGKKSGVPGWDAIKVIYCIDIPYPKICTGLNGELAFQ